MKDSDVKREAAGYFEKWKARRDTEASTLVGQRGFAWGPCGKCGKDEGVDYQMRGFDADLEVFQCRVMCRSCEAVLCIDVSGTVGVLDRAEMGRLLLLLSLEAWQDRVKQEKGESSRVNEEEEA